MNKVIDGADQVYWYLRKRPPVAGALVALIVGVFALLLLTGSGDGGSDKLPASAVAKVGDTPITRTDLAHWQTVYTTGNTTAEKPTATQARKAAFELLAGSAWIQAEAERQQLSVTDAEVLKTTNDYLKQAQTESKLTEAALLKQLGTSKADLLFQQRVSLLASKLQEKIIKAIPVPSAAAINAEYTVDPGRWAKPSERDVEALITGTKANATAALAALKGGDSFATVNEKYSTNPTISGVKGKLGKVKPGTTDPTVEKPIFAAPVGSIQGPVNAGGAFLIFKVISSTPLAEQTLAKATAAIKADLQAVAANKATASFLTNLRKRWRPQTTCAATVGASTYCSASS